MGPGRLVFKGDEKAKKKRKKTEEKLGVGYISNSGLAEPESTVESSSFAAREQPEHVDHHHDEEEASTAVAKILAVATVTAPTIHSGKGKITTSGTVVTGWETKFTREVSVGDAILVKLPLSSGAGGGSGIGKEEMRVVTMCLSDTSLNLSTAFSQNLSRQTSFQYVRKPSSQREAARAKQEYLVRKEQKEQEERAAGIFGGTAATKELVYRERTEHGSYRIKKQKVQEELSKEQLLDMRSKKTSDKYC